MEELRYNRTDEWDWKIIASYGSNKNVDNANAKDETSVSRF